MQGEGLVGERRRGREGWKSGNVQATDQIKARRDRHVQCSSQQKNSWKVTKKDINQSKNFRLVRFKKEMIFAIKR